jgi:hypothetical protein
MRQQNDLRAAVLRGDDRFKLKDEIKAGTWNVRAAGGGKAIFVNNEYSPRQQVPPTLFEPYQCIELAPPVNP